MHISRVRVVLRVMFLGLVGFTVHRCCVLYWASSTEYKQVLLWNTYWSSRSGWIRILRRIHSGRCPVSNCVFTSDKSRLGSSHAVLFHVIDMHQDQYRLPPVRDQDQHWILMSYEPPFVVRYMGVKVRQLDGVFNRTMSYRTDADVRVVHGRIQKGTGTSVARFQTDWVDSRDSVEVRNYAEGKRRLVAWFASGHGCKSQSGREYYVHELKRYVSVDVYGTCGEYKCGDSKTIKNPYQLDEDDCYMIISKNYKFYLAFENSVCRDYVTEKLYNALRLNVIPVVLGGVNYTEITPEHSVIDASKYTPKELAQYLLVLDRNDTLYNEYFRWKETYRVVGYDSVPDPCDLCAKLHTWSGKKTYQNFSDWFLSGCSPGYRIGTGRNYTT